MNRRSTALAAVLVVLGLALAGCSSSADGTSPSSSSASDLIGGGQTGKYQGFGLNPPQPRPSFTLTDTRGKPFAFGQVTRGHPTLLYFGYTRCPDVCPTTMADVEFALAKVPADLAAKTYVVFVSTDVKHDTGPIIGAWLKNFSADSKAHFIGLHGTKAQVDAAQASAHVMLASDGGETHSAQLLLYGPDDYARVSYLENSNEQGQLEHDLPVVAKT